MDIFPFQRFTVKMGSPALTVPDSPNCSTAAKSSTLLTRMGVMVSKSFFSASRSNSISRSPALILEEASRQSGITPAVIQSYDEHLADKWLNPMISNNTSKDNLLLPVRAVLSQFEVIRQIGEKGAAVIVGRCADYCSA